MTAWLPSTGTRSRRSSSTMPMAVQGANRGSPRSSRPSFSGCSPSTSLAGSMASWTSTGSSPAGSGSWTRMPWTRLVGVELGHRGQHVLLGGVGWELHPPRPDAQALGRPLLGADVDVGGLVVADQDRGQGRPPAGRGQPLHLAGQLGPDRRRRRPAVQHPRRHRHPSLEPSLPCRGQAILPGPWQPDPPPPSWLRPRGGSCPTCSDRACGCCSAGSTRGCGRPRSATTSPGPATASGRRCTWAG